MDALLLAYLGALVRRNTEDCVERLSEGVQEWLDEFLRDPDVRAEVASSLKRMGPCSAGCLIELLADEETIVRDWSEHALIGIGPSVLTALARVVEDCEPELEPVLRRVIDAIAPKRVAG